jgi:hypothetical protein
MPSLFFSVVACLSVATAVLVRLLGGSFAFFSVGLCCLEKANVPPKAVAH